ncbi:MAG: ComEC/Rec2 family competence protein [Peptoniphilaceae bacterium]|nr:MBL fold metallo-hydrolase [Peptoniphilaceae bacterium]MDD7383365.1 ComEC/Rec2 family competence protein [Peptoniphilaceae bacterium]MDY3738264.1 ComEC/Rec2 family competence protein [Peptoniphilaceae bacterium]
MKRKINTVIFIILVSILLYIFPNHEINENSNELEINYIDVGQGNCTLIECDNEVMIIDGGDRSHSSKVVSFLKKKNIKNIKYMVASHFDADHISGLVGVFYNFNVKNVLSPDYQADTKIYKSFINAQEKEKSKVIHPIVHSEYKLGDAKIRILGPSSFKYNKDNDRSIVVKLEYGNTSFLFPGDAQKESESAMIYSGENLKSDILLAGHHGSKHSTNEFFLDEVRPKVTIISVGKNNRYNHPSDEVIERLNKRSIEILRTDILGDIKVISDGKKIRIKK